MPTDESKDVSRPTPPAYTIEVFAGGHQSVSECYSVRIDVFHHEQGFPLDTEIDELEDSSYHILLRLSDPGPEAGKPVGTIRGTYKPSISPKTYKLSRLAVLKEYRKYGWGGVLVNALHDWVKNDAKSRGIEAPEVTCHSQLPVKKFYTRYGYQSEGPEFDEEGAPHQLMIARLAIA
jgi:predicted GNAT family N-acyltransferase